MKIKNIADFLESIAPLSYQESYDNCGLLVGDPNASVKKVLVTLDVTEAVVQEAIEQKCQLIVAHHPIIFSGIKKLNGKNYVERVVIKAIKHGIGIYAIHTNLDNIEGGVNHQICQRLGLQDCRILSPKKGLLKKLYTFVPVADAENVRDALFAAGAGHIGHYSEASFSMAGTGTFKGDETTNPAIGKKGKRESVAEERVETIFPAYLQNKVVNALLQAHPYEEVAYDVVSLENSHNLVGSGMVGKLRKPAEPLTFLKQVKKQLQTDCIRYTTLIDKPVETVAVCGGSGSFLLKDAKAAGAQVFITGDFKYHDFFDAEDNIIVADVGHYESEQFTKHLLADLLLKNFSTFAVLVSKINTNPIKYL